MKTLPILTACLFLTGSLYADDKPTKNADGATHVDAKAAAALVAEKDDAKKVTVLDIRTPVEFEAGHIEGATNIDFLDTSFQDAIAKLDKDKPYLVHCQSGGRSGRSLEAFKKLGFKNLYHLDGGLTAWKTGGHPVSEKTEKPKSEEPDAETEKETAPKESEL